jgi:hypothetical protein
MNLELPAVSGDARPDFVDARGCAEWLQSLPLINVGPSHGRLLGQLEELNGFAMPPSERLKVLELLREPVSFVQAEHAKKFSAKAVPLLDQERLIFNNVLALWDAYGQGWRHCLQALASGTADNLRASAALVSQRAIWALGQKLLEHFKAYQKFGEGEWRLLHQLYADAARRGVADQEVPHPAYKGEVETTAGDTYAQILLMELANPNEQTPRHQMLIGRWVERWARKVSISESAPADSGVAPLSVDLDSGSGASRAAKAGAGVRFLHLDEVGKTVKKRVAMLRDGESPEALGLGTDVPAALAANIMTMLYHQWCEDRTARKSSRRGVSKTADVCPGIAAMHYHLTGQAFKQPGLATELSQKQRDEIATFGRVSAREADTYIAVQTQALEHWTICDESLTGFHLQREEDGGRSRFLHAQLVAVRPSDAKTFILCAVRWLSVSEDYALTLGARVVPGVPRGIAIRPTGINAMAEKYVPALSLPAVAALQSPASLVVPSGWYRPKRVIEVFSEKAEQVLLTGVLERGADFDRCTFEPV